MIATTVITCRVNRLDVASHMVKLAFGIMLDGMMNGNIATPHVRMIHAIVNDENKNAQPFLSAFVAIIVNSGNPTPRAGRAHRIGYVLKLVNHAPETTSTVLFSGLDGLNVSIVEVTT